MWKVAWYGGKNTDKKHENTDFVLLLKSDDTVDKSIISRTAIPTPVE